MTGNQIQYARHLEDQRHNLASEAETRRANLARETELHRSNRVSEIELNRHNVATEAIGRTQARASIIGANAAYQNSLNGIRANELRAQEITNNWNKHLNENQNHMWALSIQEQRNNIAQQEADIRKSLADNQIKYSGVYADNASSQTIKNYLGSIAQFIPFAGQ